MKTSCTSNIRHMFRCSSTNPTITFSEEDFPLKTSIQRASDMDPLNPRNPDLTSSSNFLPVVRRRLGSIPAGCKGIFFFATTLRSSLDPYILLTRGYQWLFPREENEGALTWLFGSEQFKD